MADNNFVPFADLGPATAYAAAVEAGYTGTAEEFEELMANYATVALDAEAWANGTRSGVPVASDDKAYHKNGPYWAGQAEEQKNAASGKALDAEAWANGTRNGTAIPDTDPAYHKNGPYWVGQAEAEKNSATAKVLDAEAWANGTRNGTAIPSTDPAYHKNGPYWAGQAEHQKDLAAEQVTLAQGYANEAKAVAQTYGIHGTVLEGNDYKLYVGAAQ